MKIKTYLLSILLLNSFSVSSQISSWDWAESAPGSAEGSDLAADIYGNVYIAGNVFDNTITFGAYTLTNVAEYWSGCVAKYDPLGNVLWARIVPGSSWVYDLATDNEGSVYMSGQFDTSSLTFGSDTLNKLGAVDAFLVKYDSSGNLLWARSAGSTGVYTSGLSVATDNFGNAYLAGDGAIFLCKYDASGNLIWSHSPLSALPKHVATDATGNVYLTGYFSSSFNFGLGTLISAGGKDALLCKFDSSGNPLWAKSVGGTGDWDLGWDVGTDHQGHVYISGVFDSPILYTDSNSLLNVGCSDVFLAKYDSSGNEIWATSAGGTGNDQTGSGGLSIDENGNAFFSGSFGDSWCGWDSIVFGQFTLTESSWDPMFVVKYDPSGNVLCATSLPSGGNDVEFPNAITADPFGNAYTGADFGQNGMVVGSTTLYCSGENLFVAKYSCNKETEINELSDIISVTISPNPGNGIFQLAFNNVKAPIGELQVYNLLGEKIFSSAPSTKSYELDLINSPNGIYLLTINTSEQEIVTKIVKE